MSSGRPDFHPTMLLEGKHDTQLIPVLVDANGQMYVVMTGAGGLTVNLDAAGNIIARLQGYDGAALHDVKVDTAGNLIARMKGYDGAALQDVKVDDAGYMLAKMMGLEGANLRVVAVDANGIMKANLAVQDLAYLKFRPVYGSGVRASVAAKACSTGVETTVLEITGKGATYGGLLYTASAGVLNLQGLRLYIDDVEFYQQDYSEMTAWNSHVPDHLPIFLLRDDPTTNHWGWGIKPGITFESKFKITWEQTSGSTMYLYMDLFYALVP